MGIDAALTTAIKPLLPSIVPLALLACKPLVIAEETCSSLRWFAPLLLFISAIAVVAAQRDSAECGIEMLPSSFGGSTGDTAAGDKGWWLPSAFWYEAAGHTRLVFAAAALLWEFFVT